MCHQNAIEDDEQMVSVPEQFKVGSSHSVDCGGVHEEHTKDSHLSSRPSNCCPCGGSHRWYRGGSGPYQLPSGKTLLRNVEEIKVVATTLFLKKKLVLKESKKETQFLLHVHSDPESYGPSDVAMENDVLVNWEVVVHPSSSQPF